MAAMLRRLAFLSTCLCVSVLAAPQVEVDVNGTQVLGNITPSSSDVEVYKGIPYAVPPIDEHRLMPPVLLPLSSLNVSTFNASEFGPGCLQPTVIGTPPNVSEDCLTLNIYRPAKIQRHSRLPVVVFLPGGGFISGGSSVYDVTPMVNRSIERGTPMIMVTVNYRVGQLGFPQGEEAASKGALNLGLKDQLVALEWVKENIKYFGGDAKKVTVSGESAGATSIFYHLHGPYLLSLARAAIVESYYGFSHLNASLGNGMWSDWVSTIPSCSNSTTTNNTFTCLQGLGNSSEIYNAVTTAPPGLFIPVVHDEDNILPDFPSQLLLESGMPVLLGVNLDEGTASTPLNVTSDDIRAALVNVGLPPLRGQDTLETLVDEILAQYPDDPSLGSPYGTGNETFGLDPAFKRYAAIIGDVMYHAPTRDLADSLSDCEYPTYLYQFTEQSFSLGLPGIPEGALGVAHATELFALRLTSAETFNVTLKDPSSPAAVTLSTNMQDYWISFATSMDPNDEKGSERSEWTLYNVDEPELMQLDGTNLEMVELYRDEAMSYINVDPLVFRR